MNDSEEPRVVNVSSGHRPPENPVKGDRWRERLGCGNTFLWEWDGHKWLHRGDSFRTPESRPA